MPALSITFGVKGESATSASLIRIKKKYEELKKAASGAAKTVSEFTPLVDNFSIGLAGAALALGAVSKKMIQFMGDSAAAAQKFELAQANLKYALGATASEMEQVKKRMLEMGTSGIYDATEMTDIIYDLASGSELLAKRISYVDKWGKTVKTTLAELVAPSVQTFSLMTRGIVGANEAADTMVETINKLGLNMGKLEMTDEGKILTPLDHVLDVIAKASRLTTMKPEQWGVILNSTRASIAQSGSSIEDAVAIISTLQSMGYQPAQAGAKFTELVRKQTQMGGKFMQRRMYEELRATMGMKSKKGVSGYAGMLGKRQTYWLEKVFGGEAEFNAAWKDAQGNLGRMIDLFDVIDQKLAAKGMGGAEKASLLYKLLGDQSTMASFLLLAKDKIVDVNGEMMRGIDHLRMMSEGLKNAKNEALKYGESIKATSEMQKKAMEAGKRTFMIVMGEALLPLLNLFYLAMQKIFQAYIWLHTNFPIITKIITIGLSVATVFLGIVALIIGGIAAWGFAVFKLRGVWHNISDGIKKLIEYTVATKAATLATEELAIVQGVSRSPVVGALEGQMGGWTAFGGSLVGKRGPIGAAGAKLFSGFTGIFNFVINGLIKVIRVGLKWGVLLLGVVLIWKGLSQIWEDLVFRFESVAKFFSRTFHQLRFFWMAITQGEVLAEDIIGMQGQAGESIEYLKSDFMRTLRRIALILEVGISIIKQWWKDKDFAYSKMGMGAGLILLKTGNPGMALIALLVGFLIDMVKSPEARAKFIRWTDYFYNTIIDNLMAGLTEFGIKIRMWWRRFTDVGGLPPTVSQSNKEIESEAYRRIKQYKLGGTEFVGTAARAQELYAGISGELIKNKLTGTTLNQWWLMDTTVRKMVGQFLHWKGITTDRDISKVLTPQQALKELTNIQEALKGLRYIAEQGSYAVGTGYNEKTGRLDVNVTLFTPAEFSEFKGTMEKMVSTIVKQTVSSMTAAEADTQVKSVTMGGGR